jgi:crossover junction endodeoxyribonuclease RuvC
MIIFGIDPGTATTGFGVIEACNNAVSRVDWGVITTKAEAPLSERLLAIYDGIEGYLARYRPQRVAIEQAFYAKNVHTTLLLGHARGVLMLAAARAGAAIAEYSPRTIKKAITGNGGAEKSQVEYMIRMILSLGAAAKPSDAFDALGVAVCDFYHSGSRSIAREARGGRAQPQAGP